MFSIRSYGAVLILCLGILVLPQHVFAGGSAKVDVEFIGKDNCSKLTDRYNVRLLLFYDGEQIMDHNYSYNKKLKSVTAYDAKAAAELRVEAYIYDRLNPSVVPVKSNIWNRVLAPGSYAFHMKSDGSTAHPGNWSFLMDMERKDNTVNMYCE